MTKNLHAINFDGTTFGMDIDTSTTPYRKFKSMVKIEKVINRYGAEAYKPTVPYLFLAAIMREAHWLVSELKDFDKFCIEGFMDETFIYVKYTDVLDFRDRFGDLGARYAEKRGFQYDR